jgi:two-component system LytT family response regulator
MQGSSGIDVAACLAQPRPVIFCTAYGSQHAVDAFELHAVDYLRGSISRARLAQAEPRIARNAGATGKRGARSGDPAAEPPRKSDFPGRTPDITWWWAKGA